ncbi:hypothetical protein [Fowlpox virus]|nr:hypothetical protein [Fowlpox virus]
MEGDGQQKIVDGGIPQQKPNKGQEKIPTKVPVKSTSSNDGENKNVKQLPEKNS